MMTLKETHFVAESLANMQAAGMEIDKILRRMAQMQTKHAEFWEKTRDSVLDGKRLSSSLAQVWPTNLVNAVIAGEVSGKTHETFSRISESTALQLQIRGQVAKLSYPATAGAAGVLIFILYMLFVLPSISVASGKESGSGLMALSKSMSIFFNENWILVLGAIVAVMVLIAFWARTPEAKTAMLNLGLHIPVLRESLRDLYFGLWASYMSMMAEAGIPTPHGLRLTEAIVPELMQPSLAAFRNDLEQNNRAMSDAADPAKQIEGDERLKWWPFYVSQAWILADATGRVDTSFARISPSLIKEGMTRLSRVIQVSTWIAMAFSATLIVTPIAAYYVEMATALNSSGL